MSGRTFHMLNETKGRVPNLPFADMKDAILGKRYSLGLVFPARKRATQLHVDWKGKDGPANVLSFPLEQTSGEIYISLEAARKEYKNFGIPFDDYIGFLFVHGLLHLKGMDHGSIMERAEHTYCRRFNLRSPHSS